MKTLTRVATIDIFRALTMFFMLFVNDVPGAKNIPHWIMHAESNEDMLGVVWRYRLWWRDAE